MRMGHTAIYDPTIGSIYIYGGSKNLKWFSDIQVIGTDDWQWQMVKVGLLVLVFAPWGRVHSYTRGWYLKTGLPCLLIYFLNIFGKKKSIS